MYQLRLPCLDELFQPLPLRQIVVYLADGTTPAPVFNLDDEPRSASFLTDLSGFIEFRLATPVTLVFRVVTGTLLGDPLPLYTSGTPLPGQPEVNTQISGIVGAVGITSGYAVTQDEFGLFRVTDAEDPLDFGKTTGIAVRTGAPGASIDIVSSGYLTNTAWTFTEGKPLFLGAQGELIHAPLPGTLTFIQQIGVALSATTVMIHIAPSIKRA